jgi:hypothetical protein
VEPRRGVTESAATSSPNANVAAARSPESGGAADEASPTCTATSPGSCAGTSQNANAEDTKRIAAAPKAAPTQHASSPSRMCAPAILSSDPPDAGPSSGIAKNAAGGVRISNEGGPSPPNAAMDAGAAPIAATVTVVHPAGTRGGAAQSTVAYPTHIPLRRISADHEACGGSAPSRVPVTHTSHACTSTAGETWSPKRQVSGTSSSSYSPVFSYVTSTSAPSPASATAGAAASASGDAACVTKRNAEAAEIVEDASVLNETGDAPETRAGVRNSTVPAPETRSASGHTEPNCAEAPPAEEPAGQASAPAAVAETSAPPSVGPELGTSAEGNGVLANSKTAELNPETGPLALSSSATAPSRCAVDSHAASVEESVLAADGSSPPKWQSKPPGSSETSSRPTTRTSAPPPTSPTGGCTARVTAGAW